MKEEKKTKHLKTKSIEINMILWKAIYHTNLFCQYSTLHYYIYIYSGRHRLIVVCLIPSGKYFMNVHGKIWEKKEYKCWYVDLFLKGKKEEERTNIWLYHIFQCLLINGRVTLGETYSLALVSLLHPYPILMCTKSFWSHNKLLERVSNQSCG